MLNDELIEWRGGGDKHGARSAAAASGASRALPRGGDRAGVTGHHAGVERADINSKLERIGGDDAANASFAQATLDFAALTGKIAAAIAANGFSAAGRRGIGLLQIREQDFRMQAAIREDDGLQLAREKFLGDARRFGEIAAANAEVAVDHRRIVENEEFFGSGRAVFLDGRDFTFGQLPGQLARIRNRGRAADELRPRAVKSAMRAMRRSTLARWLPKTPR